MGRQVEWDSIPDSTLLPDDLYMIEVDSLTEETSKKGYLMYRGTLRVVEPVAFAGTPLYEYFSIGTADDPTGSEASTWKNSIGAKRLKRLFKSTLIPLTNDVDQMIEQVVGQRFVGAVGQEEDDGTRDPKYKGVKRNKINAMYPVGTHAPGAGAGAGGFGGSRSTNQAAKPAGSPAAASAKTASTISCPFCPTSMARSEYAGHVKDNHPDEA
jgi:hypothetical protein